MLPKIGYALLILGLLGKLLAEQETEFHPDQQRTIVQRSDEYTVRVRGEGPMLRLVVERGTKVTGSLTLSRDVIVQVDRIEFVPEKKVVLIGAMSGDVGAVVVINLQTSEILDKFWCYWPVISPSKRFLAFVKYYPAHFVEGVSDVYLLYDFKKSPVDNRSGNIRPDDIYDVGKVIYPPSSTNEIGDNVRKTESQAHALASGALFWSSDGRLLAFADLYQGETSLVTAVVSDSTVAVGQAEIKKSEVCLSLEKAKCKFGVSSIQFPPNGERLILTLRSYDQTSPVKEQIEIDIKTIAIRTKITAGCVIIPFLLLSQGRI
jgi:hypothetical protein